jgi:hypothetical protein
MIGEKAAISKPMNHSDWPQRLLILIPLLNPIAVAINASWRLTTMVGKCQRKPMVDS